MGVLVRWTGLVLLAGSPFAWSQDRPFSLRDEGGASIPRRENRRAEGMSREPTTKDRGASINPRLLDVVEDDTPGIRYEERDVYFRALQLAQETPLTRQERNAADFRELRRLANPRFAEKSPKEFPLFVDLFHNPHEYRGRPVSLHGVLRKLTKFDPGQNMLGIEEAYEGWIFTDDSQNHPTVVIFTSKPQGLPVGGDLAEEVRLTGYFLKMYGYEAQDVSRVAPLLMAGEVKWRPHPSRSVSQSLSLETYLIVSLMVLLVGYGVWQSHDREMTSVPRPQVEVDFSRFPRVEYSSVAGPGMPVTDDA